MKTILYRILMVSLYAGSLWGMDSDKEDINELVEKAENDGDDVLVEIAQDLFENMHILLKKIIEQIPLSNEQNYNYGTNYSGYVTNVKNLIDQAFSSQGMQYDKKQLLYLELLLYPNTIDENRYCKVQNLFLESNRYMIQIKDNLGDEEKRALYKELIDFKASIAKNIMTVVAKQDLVSAVKLLENKSSSRFNRWYNYVHNALNTLPSVVSDQDLTQCCLTLRDILHYGDLGYEQYCYVALYLLVLRQLRYFVTTYAAAGAWKGHLTMGVLGTTALFLGAALLPQLFMGKKPADAEYETYKQNRDLLPKLNGNKNYAAMF